MEALRPRRAAICTGGASNTRRDLRAIQEERDRDRAFDSPFLYVTMRSEPKLAVAPESPNFHENPT